MKKLLSAVFLVLTLLVLSGSSSAQSIYFCEGVDNSGYPITESSVFNISSSGGYLYILVRLPFVVACR
jgi:hypothetical protein